MIEDINRTLQGSIILYFKSGVEMVKMYLKGPSQVGTAREKIMELLDFFTNIALRG